jgi:glycosyltransferase involved in cell wall biosynthesis
MPNNSSQNTPSHIVIDGRIIGTGTGNYLSRMLDELQTLDNINNYTIIVTKKGQDAWQTSADNFKTVLFDHDLYQRGGLYSQLHLVKLLRSLKPDLVHFAFQFSPYLYRGKKVVGILDLTQLTYSNIKSGSNSVHRAKQKLLGHNIKWSARTADHVITISNYVKNQVEEVYNIPESRVSTTHNAANQLAPTKPSAIKKLVDKDYICYVGTALSHKNLKVLADGYKLSIKKNPGLHLAFAGKKDLFYEQLEEYCSAQLDLKHVHFLGFVSDQELSWLYQNAQAYVFPSLSEGFGLPGLEAMQNNCPLLSSNATCSPEIYGDAALYFDPKSPQDLATKLQQLLDDKTLRKDLIKKGQAQVKKYSWHDCAAKTLEVYKKILAQ